MARVQILKYREVGDTGQDYLEQMKQALDNAPMPQGGWGRLHLEGVTVGANPFAPALIEQFRKQGYKLDSLNWVYYKQFESEDDALDEMKKLEMQRDAYAKSDNEEHRKWVEDLQFRVMQDPSFQEGWDEVDTF